MLIIVIQFKKLLILLWIVNGLIAAIPQDTVLNKLWQFMFAESINNLIFELITYVHAHAHI